MGDLAYLLSKLVGILAFPLGIAFLVMLSAGLMCYLKWRRFALALVVFGWGWLWFWSMPVVADAMRDSLEAQFPYRPAAEYPEADLIVVLGGGVEGAAPTGRTTPHLVAGADREWFASELYHAGKAPLLLLSSGGGGYAEPGAAGMATFLRALGVPREALLLEPLARNTVENAHFVSKKLADVDARHILLVTSAYHMPRALQAFSAVPVRITPAATDHGPQTVAFSLTRLLPQVGALSQSTDAIREYLGMWGMGIQKRMISG